jgi:hypothetical protein
MTESDTSPVLATAGRAQLLEKATVHAIRSIPLLVLCGAGSIAAATATTGTADYAAWAKKDKTGQWTAITEAAVKASPLPKLVPVDVDKFCPGYANLAMDDRMVFWTGLVSIIARPESNFKPETTYTENFTDAHGQLVVSRGLLQISIESANQEAYGCKIKDQKSLHDPAGNLRCGVRILSALVSRDKVIASWGNKPIRGGARYWSTLRESHKHLDELSGFTTHLKVSTGPR